MCFRSCCFVGFASRLSALGLFGMTMVIQLFVVPGGWPEHILWLSLLALIIARGPGAISLDHLIWNGRLADAGNRPRLTPDAFLKQQGPPILRPGGLFPCRNRCSFAIGSRE